MNVVTLMDDLAAVRVAGLEVVNLSWITGKANEINDEYVMKNMKSMY